MLFLEAYFFLKGILAVRARKATERDYNFLIKLNKKEAFADTLCDIDDMIIRQGHKAKKGRFQSYKKHGKNLSFYALYCSHPFLLH